MTTQHTKEQFGGGGARKKWNDIRIIGPLLMAVFAMVVVTGSGFVGEENGVGIGYCDDFDTAFAVSADLDEGEPIAWLPCMPRSECERVHGLGTITREDGDCCRNTSVVGSLLVDCEEPPPAPEPEPEPETDGDGAGGEDEAPTTPVVKLPPPPDPIMGPIWLGAIDVDVIADGLVVLEFPDLLDTFIDHNLVKVYDADGALVYEGQIRADGTVMVFSSNAPMTVKTTLTTRARYTEVVAP